jgi:hypothetical protein
VATIQVALRSTTSKISAAELQNVASAINTQVTRDFKPIWNIDATVTAANPPPFGAWIITIREDTEVSEHVPPPAGLPPFAVVKYNDIWPLIASHECLEMLGNPYGSRFHRAPSLKPGQGDVYYLQEVCDPCQTVSAGYDIGGVHVSDFVTPDYFRPDLNPVAGTRYSFNGSLTHPLDIVVNGDLPWIVPHSGNTWVAKRTASGLQFTKVN